MNLIKITEPGDELPITLADAKVHLREDLADNANDAYIKALILVARAAAEDRTGRTLVTTTWQLTLDDWCTRPVRTGHLAPSDVARYGGRPRMDVIELARSPLQSVVSIKYIDVAGVQQTLAPAAYLVDNTSEPGRVVPAPGLAWPAIRFQPSAIQIQFKAGYGDDGAAVPTPIKHWIKLALTDLYQLRRRSAEKVAVPQNFADSLLDAYKIWSV